MVSDEAASMFSNGVGKLSNQLGDVYLQPIAVKMVKSFPGLARNSGDGVVKPAVPLPLTYERRYDSHSFIERCSIGYSGV